MVPSANPCQLPNGILIGSAVFAGLTNVTNRHTDRHTDRPHYSVCSNNPHFMQCVRCGLKWKIGVSPTFTKQGGAEIGPPGNRRLVPIFSIFTPASY